MSIPWQNIGTGAAAGAAAGSVVPGLGTVAGGAIGAGMGAVNWDGVGNKFRSLDPTNTPRYNPYQQYQAPEWIEPTQGASDVQAMYKALGVQRPGDTRGAEREAVMGQIAAGEHQNRAMSDQAALSRGTGAYRSGAQQGALARIGAGANAQRAGAEASIQNNYLQRQQQFDLQAMQHALGFQGDRNRFNQGNAQFGYMAGVNEHDKGFKYNQQAPYEQKQALVGGVTNGLMNIGSSLLFR